MIRITLAALALVLLLHPGQASAQEIVRAPDLGSSLADKWSWALEQGDAVIGYSVSGTTHGWGSGMSRLSLASLVSRSGGGSIPAAGASPAAVMITITGSRIDRINTRSMRHTGPEEVDRILWLGEAGQAESFELLTTLDLSGDALRGSLYAIGHHRDVRDAGPWIRRYLDPSTSVDLRKSATYSYGEYGGTEALSVLGELAINDRSTEVAKAAAYAIGNVDDDRAVLALDRLIKRSDRSEVRKAAVYALGNTDSAQARRILLALILEES